MAAVPLLLRPLKKLLSELVGFLISSEMDHMESYDKISRKSH